jgi:hopanoid biosynthesis associated protein HpnK
VRQFIVNADDFGFTSGVNRAIVEAHQHGIVTSATLMARAPASAEAVQLAHATPSLSIGCHFVLVDGEPVADRIRVPSLVRSGTADFHPTLARLALHSLLRKLDTDEVETETTAQIRWLQSNGIAVSHLDTHKHAHVLPAVLAGVLRAARACGIRAVRNPFEPPWSFSLRPEVSSMEQRKRQVAVRAFRIWEPSFHEAVKKAGLLTTDGTLGIAVTGCLDAHLFRRIIENMPVGTWEFVCHPGHVDDALRHSRTRLRESRARELEVLTSSEIRRILAEHDVQLISYADLPKSG